MQKTSKAAYRLRFFFDYNCGGCLWNGNEASFEKFGLGCLDAEIYDLTGRVSQEARIKLPASIRQKVLELNDLYSTSIDFNKSAKEGSWSKIEWDKFYSGAKEVFDEISQFLGDDYILINEVEKNIKL